MAALDNLVINPSGEQSFNIGWTGTNGLITTAALNAVTISDVLVSSTTNEYLYDSETGLDTVISTFTRASNISPYEGTGLIRYEITSQGGVGYRVTAPGPQGSPHYGAFRINELSRTIAFSTVLASDDTLWVQPTARFASIFSGNVVESGSVALGAPVQLTGPTGWLEVRRTLVVPNQSSHWYLDFLVYANDPRVDAVTPPTVGSVLYIDSTIVPSSGTLAPTDTYFDGDFPGASWLGDANNSISFIGTTYAPVGINEYGGSTGGDGTNGGDGNDAGSGSGGVDTSIPPVDLFSSDVAPVDIAENLVGFRPPGGLCLSEDVVIGDLTLNRLDEAGVLWVVTDIEGWHTLPEPDMPDFPRGSDDGSYESRGRYNARIITVSGSFYPSSPSQVAAARRKLLHNVNLCHKGSWFATHEPDGTRASRVWLSGQPQVTTVNTAGRTDFSVGLKAPDPVKYGLKDRTLPGWFVGEARSQSSDNISGGRVYPRAYPWSYQVVTNTSTTDLSQYATTINAVNNGNTRVYPIITVSGPTYGPVIINNESTHQSMRIVKNLNPDDKLVIDCFNKSVKLNNIANSRFYLEMILDWIYLDPGSNEITWTDTGASSAGILTVQWRPGWIG